MAKILPDREIRPLIGSVLVNGHVERLNPNGIELRLGKRVRFHSTNEERDLAPDCYLKVSPGESVVISSLETIDFTNETVSKYFPGKTMMGLITPTTTMMREGISQVSTKIDVGFRGNLNWGLRNSSTRDLILAFGEPIFKLTLLLLDKDESPETPYGGRPHDAYQDSAGVVRSKRQIPADMPEGKVVSSSFKDLDPKKALRDAGYPFDHIGTELISLHGKFEVVSSNVALLKDDFDTRARELTLKIEKETSSLMKNIEESKVSVIEKVESLFDRKFMGMIGTIVGAISIMYAIATFLVSKSMSKDVVGLVSLLAGVAIILTTFSITRRSK
ncbi:MAG TPA: hypothetical protein VMW75_13350 [Thermoanaerobaculia bacterium]|nr:hypothetical protein [Thermoanaerobaculia bacterium]